MIRNLLILWLSLSLISSVVEIVSMGAQRNKPEFDKVRLLTDQVQDIENALNNLEEKKEIQPAISAELAKVKADLSTLKNRHFKNTAFDWWVHGVHPILTLLVLIYCLNNKNFLADHASSGQPTANRESKSEGGSPST